VGERKGGRNNSCYQYVILLVECNQLIQRNTTDPATDEELGTVPEMGLEEAKSAIAAAGKAFASWGKTTAKVGILYSLLAYTDEHHAYSIVMTF
jgi:acyl-CoA reductase-like NAD-dependent aldehyde dehydrogenase